MAVARFGGPAAPSAQVAMPALRLGAQAALKRFNENCNSVRGAESALYIDIEQWQSATRGTIVDYIFLTPAAMLPVRVRARSYAQT